MTATEIISSPRNNLFSTADGGEKILCRRRKRETSRVTCLLAVLTLIAAANTAWLNKGLICDQWGALMERCSDKAEGVQQ
jgi:hypothetical protein